MNSKHYKADLFLWRFYRVAWLLVSVFAVYILRMAYEFYLSPSAMLGNMLLLPDMVEHLLASCMILFGVGALFEYLCRFD